MIVQLEKIFSDFAIMSILLFIAHILRSKLGFLQKIYIPSSIIAGFIALFGGWQFLRIFPFAMENKGTPQMAECLPISPKKTLPHPRRRRGITHPGRRDQEEYGLGGHCASLSR